MYRTGGEVRLDILAELLATSVVYRAGAVLSNSSSSTCVSNLQLQLTILCSDLKSRVSTAIITSHFAVIASQ